MHEWKADSNEQAGDEAEKNVKRGRKTYEKKQEEERRGKETSEEKQVTPREKNSTKSKREVKERREQENEQKRSLMWKARAELPDLGSSLDKLMTEELHSEWVSETGQKSAWQSDWLDCGLIQSARDLQK